MTFREALDFDRDLVRGARVMAHWTNSGSYFRAQATVERVNGKSVSVTLDEATEGYPEGWKIACPRPLSKSWSWNNCLLPAKPAPVVKTTIVVQVALKVDASGDTVDELLADAMKRAGAVERKGVSVEALQPLVNREALDAMFKS